MGEGANEQQDLSGSQRAPSDAAARVLEILLADRERMGELDPDRVDTLVEKRSLDAGERIWVYRQLGMDSRAQAVESGLDDPELDETDVDSSDASMDHVRYLLGATDSIPFLTAEDERTLGRTIQNGEFLKVALEEERIERDEAVEAAIARSDAAQRQMILANLRLVVSIAAKYRRRSSLDLADLVQEGIVGLMRAVRKFDPNMDTKLSTYATWWIRQSIERAIHDTSKTIRIPVHMVEKIIKLRKALRRLSTANGRNVTIGALASELGWSEEETTAVYAHGQMHFVSTDETLDEVGDRRAALILVDPEPTPDAIFLGRELERVLRETVNELSLREQEIVKRRFGFGVPDKSEETLEQIGQDHGVTRERIRQIEAKALRRLAHPKRLKRLVDFTEC